MPSSSSVWIDMTDAHCLSGCGQSGASGCHPNEGVVPRVRQQRVLTRRGDFLDVMYNCCALASYEGITAVGLEEVKSETGVQSVDWDRWAKRR